MMSQSDHQPPPEGLLTGDGFTSPPSAALTGSKPAEIIPHKGLIVMIMGSKTSGFPVEEYVHTGPVVRNPELIGTALTEYWRGRTGAYNPAIMGWSPFVEAMHNVYEALHQEAKPLDEYGDNVQNLNKGYAGWYANQVFQLGANVDKPSTKESGPNNESLSSLQEKITASITATTSQFIEEYKANELHRHDIHEHWSRVEGGKEFLILMLVELFLPAAATARAQERFDVWIHRVPPHCWASIEGTLIEWLDLVKKGTSPFPIQNLTPPVLFDWFEWRWTSLTALTMHLISEAILSSEKESYLTKSLPSLYHNLNPYTALQWFGSAHNIHRYPVLVLHQDLPECAIIEHIEDPMGDLSYAKAIWHGYKRCPLYADLDEWCLSTKGLYYYKRDHFTTMALQVWQFLTRVEHLWQQHNDPAETDCTHCQALLKRIADNSSLVNALEVNLFTQLGLRPLLNAARQYIPWIEESVTQTYHSHPLLPHQENAVYRQHLPF